MKTVKKALFLQIYIEQKICLMSENIEKRPAKKGLNKIIEKEIPSRIIDTGKHKGKVKWGEDPLKWQKKIRDEWR